MEHSREVSGITHWSNSKSRNHVSGRPVHRRIQNDAQFPTSSQSIFESLQDVVKSRTTGGFPSLYMLCFYSMTLEFELQVSKSLRQSMSLLWIILLLPLPWIGGRSSHRTAVLSHHSASTHNCQPWIGDCDGAAPLKRRQQIGHLAIGLKEEQEGDCIWESIVDIVF